MKNDYVIETPYRLMIREDKGFDLLSYGIPKRVLPRKVAIDALFTVKEDPYVPSPYPVLIPSSNIF